MFEVEVKFRVDDYEHMVGKLNAIGATFDNPGTQRDVVFIDADTVGFNIKPGTPVVRVRSEGGKVSLTMKKRVTDGQSVEHELYISDTDKMTQILENLGLKKTVEVVKQRKTAQINGLTYCLDIVDGAGCFLEIEDMVEKNEDVDKAYTTIMAHARDLGLDEKDIERDKYDTLVYRNSKKG